MPRRYPLEPLVGVRRQRVEKRTGELGKAALERKKEQEAADAAKARHADARRSARSERERESAELERGALTARDLVQGVLHQVGVAARLSELARGEAAAADRLGRARAAETSAKGALGRAQAERDAVLKHRGRFRATLEKKQEVEQEDDAADRFTAARREGRRR
jgi:hypothetical protein